ncbi:uncharacterized protein CANTADRAFT_43562 [Suhomyces tanzawaensis NRRL Y-17324]|uniref:C2H2-type domain-containing protein n=1 Tax=Suhomyces tanzawaensis NRRL Y-17324 TaxID=984487 RepID=A0A1E4SQR3_9ASCO|nr:uncharacterized protein CANTADRAFT_43562 [Suhomyces tanzawaensis NRRL Y-17324]ODV81853.1 hypothetical protein CANTADRAFT_43562 [Suhomyces tanzawaensis NRRL Y-17324]
MATKKYICAFCARAFTRSEHKQRHERSHTNEKPFHCLHCTSSFVRRDLLQRHCRTVHNFQLSLAQIQQGEDDHRAAAATSSQSPPAPAASAQTASTQTASTHPATHATTHASTHAPTSPHHHPDPKKRKKSDDKPDLTNHDLIHLLSITRKLELVLVLVDASNADYALNDYFLIGYIHLVLAAQDFHVFDRLLKDLFSYLNSFNVNARDKHLHHHPNLFKVGIIYAVVSLGYKANRNRRDASKFLLKSWNLLIKKLIPNYNNDNNVLDQIEILNNLFLLLYIYIEFDYASFDGDEFEDEGTLISDDIILNYLNDISYIILSNLNNMSASNDNIIDGNLNMFWNIYILLSNALKGGPPKFYSFFVHRRVVEDASDDSQPLTLFLVMSQLSKSFISLPPQSEAEAKFLNSIIISTLFNELKLYLSGENFLIFSSRNYLHNSIILINKSINIHNNLTMISTPNDLLFAAPTHPQSLKLFELFKKNVIINSPLKFHELLNNYLFIPAYFYNWQLLTITLQEINMNYPINQFVIDYMSSPNPQTLNVNLTLSNYFNYKSNPVEINNNLSIISFPIIFFTKYLHLNIIDLKSYNILQLNFINTFIIEWFVIMNKIIIMIWNNTELFDDNYILQNLIYLLLDNKNCLSKKLNIQSNGPEEEDFTFNQKWFWVIKLKLDHIFESWMNLVKTPNSTSSVLRNSNNLSILKVNISKYINDLIQREVAKFQEERYTASAAPMNSMYLNYSNSYNVLNNDFDHMMGTGARRANSITLGILGTGNNTSDLINNVSPVMSNSSSSSSASGPVRQGSIGMGKNYNSHAPALATGLGPAPAAEIPVLPPILGKSYGGYEFQGDKIDVKGEAKMVPGVMKRA